MSPVTATAVLVASLPGLLPAALLAGTRRRHRYPLGFAALAASAPPGRRPFHTLNPALAVLKDGRIMAYGAMGGEGQPQTQGAIFTRHVVFDEPLAEAIDHPRLLPMGGKVQVEHGIPADLCDRLTRLGHTIEAIDRPHGGGQAIWIDHARGCLIGGSDPRKDGMALGY